VKPKDLAAFASEGLQNPISSKPSSNSQKPGRSENTNLGGSDHTPREINSEMMLQMEGISDIYLQ
jgi:hypothetical protein